MSQIFRSLDQQQLKALCGVVAHTSQGLTKSELTVLLGQCGNAEFVPLMMAHLVVNGVIP